MRKKDSINDFRLADSREISEYCSGHGILLGSPGGISTYVVYDFLKKHFGVSNYHAFSDRTTWEYVLKGPRRYLRIHDWKLHDWHIAICLPYPKGSITCQNSFEKIHEHDQEARADANILVQEIAKYAKTINIPITKHSHQIIENTYRISYYYGEHFLASLEKPKDRSLVPEFSKSFMHLVSFEDCSEVWAAIMAFILSVEAMFNILFEIYLRTEIREDEMLRQHVFRLPLLDKWLLSASLCNCFEKPLNRKCRGFQSLKRLTSIRNAWAHATVSDEMRTYFIRRDGLTFATKRPSIYKERERAHVYPHMSSVDFVSAVNVKKDADTIKSQILEAMKANDKRRFKKALEEQYILLSRKGKLLLWNEV
jgi:hypothetical protein